MRINETFVYCYVIFVTFTFFILVYFCSHKSLLCMRAKEFNTASNCINALIRNFSETLSETKMTQPRARVLHKSGQNGKSGSGDTIGIRVPSEDALRKIAFNVASASDKRSKKNARQGRTKIHETGEKKTKIRSERAGDRDID